MLDIDAEMILQIAADRWPREPHRDAVLGQQRRVADARELQKLRRVDGAAAQRDLAAGGQAMGRAALPVCDARATQAVEGERRRLGAGDDAQVWPCLGGSQEGGGGGDAATLLDVEVVEPKALLLGAIGVVVRRHPRREGRREPRGVEGIFATGLLREQVAVAAVIGVGPGMGAIALERLEQRQHILVAPAREPELAPVIIVSAMTTHIHHAVDGRGPAQHPAARPDQAAPVQPWIRFRPIGPVERFEVVEKARQQRHADQRIAVTPAGFQQHNTVLRIGGEAVGEQAAGRARADDDEIRLRHQPACSSRWRMR